MKFLRKDLDASEASYESRNGMDDAALYHHITSFFASHNLKSVLLLPPDITRMNSGAGKITNMLYHYLEPDCRVDIMPALGTHLPMTRAEQISFFGADIPENRYLVHNWRNGVEKIGVVPDRFVSEVSEGLVNNSIDVEVSTHILYGGYDLIVSIGQVVPHEVVGMASYTKNILVGCGGLKMISSSHMVGAFYGLERLIGTDQSPVRRIFDYVEENLLQEIPLIYILTVTTLKEGDRVDVNGLYMGRSRRLFEQAASLSQKLNITKLSKPIRTCIVYLDQREFRSMWLGNKAIYRTKKAMAEGGRLMILAKGVEQFGEDTQNDQLIRKYGYIGRKNILALLQHDRILQDNLSVAAHLIHGSSDGRFEVIYCVEKMSRQEIEDVNFRYMPLAEILKRYPIEKLEEGWNTIGGEEIYYISNPAVGLWVFEAQA